MSLATHCPDVILETILDHLATLFLAGAHGNIQAARQAAATMLAAYGPQTEDEHRLAAQIISFGFHALEALSQATMPEMPLNRILRLRGSAVSLSREAEKAQRRLDRLQQARLDGTEAPADPPPLPLSIEKACDLVDDTRRVAAAAKAAGVTWTQAYQQRQRTTRITENLKKNQARHAARPTNAPPTEA
jgi:hypothetical protein